MKRISIILFFSLLFSIPLFSQEQLKQIPISKDISTHFVCLEEVLYVDISTDDIVGDIPQPNLVRIKPTKEGASGVITIVTERYMVQYALFYSDQSGACTKYTIPYNDITSYVNTASNITKAHLNEYANKVLFSKKKYYNVSSKNAGARIKLNNIYTIDRYFFFDISIENHTNIIYDIENIRFKIEDKKKKKRTNFQSLEIKPILSASSRKSFKKNYRNVFVFDKFTFPEEKVFLIELSEKQISGRTLSLEIEYSDILTADQFVNP